MPAVLSRSMQPLAVIPLNPSNLEDALGTAEHSLAEKTCSNPCTHSRVALSTAARMCGCGRCLEPAAKLLLTARTCSGDMLEFLVWFSEMLRELSWKGDECGVLLVIHSRVSCAVFH